jgi:hypothetical protein
VNEREKIELTSSVGNAEKADQYEGAGEMGYLALAF